jgi:hypothetical protein
LFVLQVLKRSGTEQEKKHARRIEPVRLLFLQETCALFAHSTQVDCNSTAVQAAL